MLVGFTSQAFAQQNLFNVPSSDITIKSKGFFQQQINLPRNGTVLLNSTFCWGLGNEFEIGFNVLGLFLNTGNPGSTVLSNSDENNPPVYPFYTINAQKAWTLNKSFKLALGTQTGFSAGMHFGTYNYLNLVTAIPKYQLKIVTGMNHGSESFLGPGDLNPLLPADYDPVGFQIGLEQEILKEKILLLAEHISGDHSLGVSVLGLGYHLTEHWVLSAGYQFSSSGNSTPNSLVFELTFVPSVISHRRIYREGHLEVE